MAVSDIVSSTISIKDAVPAGASFSTVAIFAYHTHGLGAWKTYTLDSDGLSSMVTDGFATWEAPYKMVAAMSAQSPKADKVKIFPRAVVHAKVTVFTPTDTAIGKVTKLDVSDGGVYSTLSYTNGGSETATTIVTALQAQFAAITPALNAGGVVGAGIWTITSTNGHPFYFKNASANLTVADTTTDADIATDLAAGAVLDNEWYGLLTDCTGKAACELVATYAESNTKWYQPTSFETAILGAGTTDLGAETKASGFTHTEVCYSGDLGAYLGAAIISRQFSQQPGSSSWHMKQANGVTADNLSATALSNARGKNVLVYVADRGISHTFDGKAASGRFADITYGSDWLNGRIQDDQLALQMSREKIDFNEEGIGLIQATLEKSLDAGVQAKLVQPGYVITVPKLSTISPTDKTNRLLQLVKWNGILTGAVNKAVFNGVLTP